MTKKIYFGHHITLYNTEDEVRLVGHIGRVLPYEVENPNQPHHDKAYMKRRDETGNGMDYYFEEVLPKMGAGVFIAFKDGKFGAGVFGEADFLLRAGKPIYEIDLEGRISEMASLDSSRRLSVEETRERIKEKVI